MRGARRVCGRIPSARADVGQEQPARDRRRVPRARSARWLAAPVSLALCFLVVPVAAASVAATPTFCSGSGPIAAAVVGRTSTCILVQSLVE